MKSPRHVGALNRICRRWSYGGGAERFWDFDDVLEALSRKGTAAWFAAEDVEATDWYAAAFVAMGPDAADLLYVYVAPEARRLKLGRRLMEAVIKDLGAEPGVEALFLEVRASNVAAQALYRSFGMEEVSVRKRYYRDGEDALVFKLPLKGEGADPL